MLALLCIHEGVPGHYLQLAWSNKTPNLTRTIFSSGMFAEGWAVYVTQVMMDLGYGDHEPRAVDEPLEVLPARHHQRDHGRAHPHRGHDRGRRRWT